MAEAALAPPSRGSPCRPVTQRSGPRWGAQGWGSTESPGPAWRGSAARPEGGTSELSHGGGNLAGRGGKALRAAGSGESVWGWGGLRGHLALPLAPAAFPHPGQAGHGAAPHLRLRQQPRGAAHEGAGGQGWGREPRYRSPERGGDPSLSQFPLRRSPPHPTFAALLRWDPQACKVTSLWWPGRPSAQWPSPRTEFLARQEVPREL